MMDLKSDAICPPPVATLATIAIKLEDLLPKEIPLLGAIRPQKVVHLIGLFTLA